MMGKLKHPKKHISQNRSVKNNKTNQPKIRTKWQEREREDQWWVIKIPKKHINQNKSMKVKRINSKNKLQERIRKPSHRWHKQ